MAREVEDVLALVRAEIPSIDLTSRVALPTVRP
jgi:hypothetical protein